MSWNEILQMVGQDWMLYGLAVILLFMFLRRALRVGGFLGFTGLIATAVLLVMLTWIQWNKYQVATTIIEIVQEENPTYQVLTPDQEPIFNPKVVTRDDMQYIIDGESENPKYYFPWKVIAVPK